MGLHVLAHKSCFSNHHVILALLVTICLFTNLSIIINTEAFDEALRQVLKILHMFENRQQHRSVSTE